MWNQCVPRERKAVVQMALFQAVWVEAALAMVVLVVALVEAVLAEVVLAVTALEVVGLVEAVLVLDSDELDCIV